MNDSTLRPMSISQVLDRTFHLYRTNFVFFVGIGLIVPVLILISELVFAFLGLRPGSRNGISPQSTMVLAGASGVVVLLVSTLAGALAQGATVFAVSRIHLGRPVTIGESYQQVLSCFASMLRIFISLALRTAGPYLPAIAVFSAGFTFLAESSGGDRTQALAYFGLLSLLAFPLFVGGVIGSLYLYARYSLAVPACILEKLRGAAALRRSSFLSKDSILRIILIFFLLGILTVIFSLVLNLPVQIVAIQRRGILATPWVIWSYAGNFLARALAGPIAAIALALIYYDQRVRKEAFDLQLMMQGLETPEVAAGVSPVG
jgi:hypothetical protein